LGVGATLAVDLALGRVGNWLAREFAPHRVAKTLRALAEARPSPAKAATDVDVTSKSAECDRKLAQYRATLDAGANSDTVAAWIAETEAENASYALAASKPEPRRRLTEQEIKGIEAYSQTGIIYIKTRQPRRAYMKAACFSK
jgi:hypothetical protein